jgi:hypothetical protein
VQLKTREKQAKFLEQYVATGEIGPAARAAGIERTTHYVWMKRCASYKARFEEAQRMRVEVLETEVRRRALVGWLEPVYYKGQKLGDVRKFSDVLLIFALKAERPEKYRERVEHRLGSEDGSPLKFVLAVERPQAAALQPAPVTIDVPVNGNGAHG